MKWLLYLLSSVWRLWFFLVFITVFIAFIPVLFFFTAIIKNHMIVAKLTSYWSKLTIWLSFIIPIVEWEADINKKNCYIFCPNHVSTLDIPLILAVLPVPLQFIGKAEIAKLPLFGYFYKNNSVIVNRENRKDAYTAFVRAGVRLEKGLNMCIFPEGGIPPENIFLKKFKNGPFRLATDKNIPIIPITLPDNKSMFPQEYFKGRPGFVRVKIHKSIYPNKISENSINDLNNSVYNTIFEQLKIYEK